MYSEAWEEGRDNGRLDRQIGHLSLYAWHGTSERNTYTREYAHGYRTGYSEAKSAGSLKEGD